MIRLCLFLSQLAFVIAQSSVLRPVIETSNGPVRGIREYSGLFNTFYSFKGIPYAEPPVGELRFRNPLPHKGWSDVLDASRHRSHCPNDGFAGIGAGGDEDCLFLNVFTPALPNPSRQWTVMIWIHGGAFYIGDGDTLIYGPDLILRENVIVVSFNYRLSALGFLCTGDKHAQGNYGLKDITLAVRWVRENIQAFGGNPDKITLFGQSAGSVAVHLLSLSEMSRGLYDQAIMMSGTGLAPFSFQRNPKHFAEELGNALGLNFNSSESLVDELRKVDHSRIMRAQKGLLGMDNPLGLQAFDFVPCAEPEDSEEEIFLSDEPIKLMLNGSIYHTPIIIGLTSNEGLLMVRQSIIDFRVFDEYNDNLDWLVPQSFELDKESVESKNVSDTFLDMYFDGEQLSRNKLDEWAEYHTDAQFGFPTDRTVKIIAESTPHPIYYYHFSFTGSLNFLKTLLLMRSYDGVCHADDIFYLFSPAFPIPIWPLNDPAPTVRRRYIRLFTNFAKYGNPTPTTDDDLIRTKWLEYDPEDQYYMDIGSNLTMYQHKPRLEQWHSFQKNFTGHL